MELLANMNQLEERTVFEGEKPKIDYEAIIASHEFKQLLSAKKKFTIPYTVFYIAYSLLLPVMAFYSNVLNTPVFGDITWAWIYAISFIPVSLTVCNIYVRKAVSFDQRAKEILEREGL